MALQYVTDEVGEPTAVVVPIEEWDEIIHRLSQSEPARNDTDYFFRSDTMKRRLLEARKRKEGKSWDEVRDALGL